MRLEYEVFVLVRGLWEGENGCLSYSFLISEQPRICHYWTVDVDTWGIWPYMNKVLPDVFIALSAGSEGCLHLVDVERGTAMNSKEILWVMILTILRVVLYQKSPTQTRGCQPFGSKFSCFFCIQTITSVEVTRILFLEGPNEL